MPVLISTIGTVEPLASVQVRPQLEEDIEKVLVKDGQVVKANDPLFELDQHQTLLRMKQAAAVLARDRAQLANARRDLARMTPQLNSQQQIDQAKTTVEALEATVRGDEAAYHSAELMHSYTVIRAPIGGRLGAISRKEGNLARVSDPAPLVTINQIRPTYVAFVVPERQLGAIRDAMNQGTLTVTAVVPGDESHLQKGKVSFIDNAVDSSTGTVLLKAQFENPDERLWPGAHTEISLTVRVQAEAIVVPSQAIQQSQGGALAFVIKEDNTVETRLVQVDRVAGDVTVISKGLEKGQRVVVEGQLRLVNGAAVDVVKTLEAPKP